MRTIESIIEEAPLPPDKLRLACGHDVPHRVGQPIFNYYDMKAGQIQRTASSRDAQPDTSGQLPNGIAWWVDTDTGTLDGSRMICFACADARGWLQ